MESSFGLSNTLSKILLTCGILSAVLYTATDLAAGLLTPGYRFDSQSASVLSAHGAATRKFVLSSDLISWILLIAFSTGLWLTSRENWMLRAVAVLLAGNALFSITALSFFPFYPEEAMNSTANKINVILMFISVFLFFLAICFGAAANQNWFRYFSLGIIGILFIGTIFGFAISRSETSIFGQHGPLVGIQERTIIYTWQLWLALQAIVLMR